jgi:copper chaperone
MARHALSLSLVLSVALVSGCQKHNEASDKSDPKAAEAAAQKPGAIAEVQPTQTVAAKVDQPAQEGEYECANKKPGESCGSGCDQWNEAAGAVTARVVPKDAEWTTMAVEGMTCSGCEQRIIANVGGIDGVLAVEADAELGQVRVATAKGMTDLRKQAASKISELGYRVQ